MVPRKSPANAYVKALEALFENDKRIAGALDPGEGMDWAPRFVEIMDDPTLGPLVTKLLIRDPDSPDCMIWGGNADANGYPRVRAFGRLRPVSRVVWQILNHVPLTPVIVIRMTCGKKRCFNPEHMRFDPRVGPLFQAGFGKGSRPTVNEDEGEEAEGVSGGS